MCVAAGCTGGKRLSWLSKSHFKIIIWSGGRKLISQTSQPYGEVKLHGSLPMQWQQHLSEAPLWNRAGSAASSGICLASPASMVWPRAQHVAQPPQRSLVWWSQKQHVTQESWVGCLERMVSPVPSVLSWWSAEPEETCSPNTSI